jgi:hypothetical protein
MRLRILNFTFPAVQKHSIILQSPTTRIASANQGLYCSRRTPPYPVFTRPVYKRPRGLRHIHHSHHRSKLVPPTPREPSPSSKLPATNPPLLQILAYAALLRRVYRVPRALYTGCPAGQLCQRNDTLCTGVCGCKSGGHRVWHTDLVCQAIRGS